MQDSGMYAEQLRRYFSPVAIEREFKPFYTKIRAPVKRKFATRKE